MFKKTNQYGYILRQIDNDEDDDYNYNDDLPYMMWFNQAPIYRPMS